MVCDPYFKDTREEELVVLILILLEYGLRPDKAFEALSANQSLNPYSTGIWSATPYEMALNDFLDCLNPYSTGIWSATRCGLLYKANRRS